MQCRTKNQLETKTCHTYELWHYHCYHAVAPRAIFSFTSSMCWFVVGKQQNIINHMGICRLMLPNAVLWRPSKVCCCWLPHGLRLGCWAVINRVKVMNMLWITGGPGKRSTGPMNWSLIGRCSAPVEATPLPTLEVIWRANDLWPHPKKDDRKLCKSLHWPICGKNVLNVCWLTKNKQGRIGI